MEALEGAGVCGSVEGRRAGAGAGDCSSVDGRRAGAGAGAAGVCGTAAAGCDARAGVPSEPEDCRRTLAMASNCDKLRAEDGGADDPIPESLLAFSVASFNCLRVSRSSSKSSSWHE